MPAAPLLSQDQIEAAMTGLPGWSRAEGRLVKSFRFTDFREALEFLNAVAVPAEEQNHHPDVEIHWNELTLVLWTHAAGGVTQRDVRLALAIEQLARARSAPPP